MKDERAERRKARTMERKKALIKLKIIPGEVCLPVSHFLSFVARKKQGIECEIHSTF